jgi:hypothetical protein
LEIKGLHHPWEREKIMEKNIYMPWLVHKITDIFFVWRERVSEREREIERERERERKKERKR